MAARILGKSVLQTKLIMMEKHLRNTTAQRIAGPSSCFVSTDVLENLIGILQDANSVIGEYVDDTRKRIDPGVLKLLAIENTTLREERDAAHDHVNSMESGILEQCIALLALAGWQRGPKKTRIEVEDTDINAYRRQKETDDSEDEGGYPIPDDLVEDVMKLVKHLGRFGTVAVEVEEE